MRKLLLWLVAVLVAGRSSATLAPPPRAYNVLMMLPVSSLSHRNVFMPLATALTRRGHKITMLSNHPPADDNPNIEYIQSPLEYFDTDLMDAFEMNPREKMLQMFEEVIPKIANDIYEVPAVADLYSRRKEFDLIVIDAYFNEALLPFAHNHTLITVSTSHLISCTSATLGNVLNPAYVPNMIGAYEQPFSTLTRWWNVLAHILTCISWRKAILAPAQVEISKRFPALPSLDEILRNQSLVFVNSHFSHALAVPLLPNQVEVGGLHIGPAKPLPKDLEEFLAGSVPVVYMSLGSIARSSAMPEEYKQVFFKVFPKLPYKVVWKFEEKPENISKNVFIQKWMPQQDVLAHPNVKVFISHCGLLSSLEALHYGVPILGLPIFSEQPKNAEQLVIDGVARKILWSDLTEELLYDAIEDLITNPKYAEKANEISTAMRDRPLSAVDTAVFWTEYVIRHRGAVHMRSPAADLTWVQALHLDLLLLLHLVLWGSLKLSSKLWSACRKEAKAARPSAKKLQ